MTLNFREEDEDGRWRWLWGEWDCFQKKRLGDTFVAFDREYDSLWIVDFVSIMKKFEKSEMLFRRSNVRDVEFWKMKMVMRKLFREEKIRRELSLQIRSWIRFFLYCGFRKYREKAWKIGELRKFWIKNVSKEQRSWRWIFDQRSGRWRWLREERGCFRKKTLEELERIIFGANTIVDTILFVLWIL